MSNEVFVQDNNQSILTNATVTSNGSAIITGYGFQQISLVINVKASPTGTTPTITFTIQELDPGDKTTTFGNSSVTSAINAIGVYTATLSSTTSGSIKVSWSVGGSSPSFTQLYATVVAKATPSTQAISTASTTTTPQISFGTVTTTSIATTAIRASTYNEQSANAQRSFASSSANDTSAGTGARQILLTYYDSTGAGPFTETVTLNGTGNVNTVSSTICFIERIEVTSVGSGGSNAGTITMFVSTAGGGGTLATVNVGDNRTFWAHHYVGTGKTANITGLSGHNTSASNGSVLSLKAKPLNVATATEAQISDFVRCGGGTSQPVRSYDQLIRVAGPARIILYEACEGTPSITTRAGFDYYDQ